MIVSPHQVKALFIDKINYFGKRENEERASVLMIVKEKKRRKNPVASH